MDLRKIVEDLIECFLNAGDLAIELREKGLIKKIKSDNTPVSNGDLEVNNLISKKISKVTPEIPIISEESLENKDKSNLKNFWLIDPIDLVVFFAIIGSFFADAQNNKISPINCGLRVPTTCK